MPASITITHQSHDPIRSLHAARLYDAADGWNEARTDWRDSDTPFAAVCDGLVGAGFELVFRISDDEGVFRRSTAHGDAALSVSWYRGDGYRLGAIGATQDAVNAAIDAARLFIPSRTYADPTSVDVSFWSYDPMGGGSRYVRNLERLPWSDTESNYPTAVRATLGDMCRWESGPPSGRLMVFHGPPGTGKSRYLQTLASEWSEWCVDEQTEILTEDGWRRYDQLADRPRVLTLNTDDRTSRWEDLCDVNIWPERRRMLRRFEWESFSALVTEDHRWFVRQTRSNPTRHQWEWRTTETLTTASSVPRAVPHDNPNDVPKFSDAFVEAVAWFWTEGTVSTRGRSERVSIAQSHEVNGNNVDRLRAALTAAFGAPSERADRGMTTFTLRVGPSAALRGVTGDDKQPTPSFLRSLTHAQLLLLIDTALAGDGTVTTGDRRYFYQQSEAGVRAFEMACALAGIATNTRPHQGGPGRFGGDVQCVTLMRTPFAGPIAATNGTHSGARARNESVPHDGIVWCPTTPSGTWLARRRGSVYWTGNCAVHYVVDPDMMFREANYMTRVMLGEERGDRWRLIVVEDGDEFIDAQAKARSGYGVSRLLNIADGLVGQGLRIMVLVSTNVRGARFNKAIIRPGRCSALVEFPPFPAPEAAAWLAAHDVIADDPTGPVTLAGLYAAASGASYADDDDDEDLIG